MSARVELLRALACVGALAVFACGDDEEAAPEPSSADASASRATEAASPGATSVPDAYATVADPQPARELTESERRVNEILDVDAEGAGLDVLMRYAREDADPAVREAAVIALGDSDEARAIDALIAATEDADKRVVLAAIDQLSWFDERPARDALERLTDSSDAEIAEAAEEALMD